MMTQPLLSTAAAIAKTTKAAHKERAAKKPKATDKNKDIYGMWTFPASAEAAAAFLLPPAGPWPPLFAAVPRPSFLLPTARY